MLSDCLVLRGICDVEYAVEIVFDYTIHVIAWIYVMIVLLQTSWVIISHISDSKTVIS